MSVGGKIDEYGLSTGGKSGYIDKTRKYVVPPQYDWTYGFSEGFASVNIGAKDEDGFPVGGKLGYINQTGKVVIDLRFDEAEGFENGLARVAPLVIHPAILIQPALLSGKQQNKF